MYYMCFQSIFKNVLRQAWLYGQGQIVDKNGPEQENVQSSNVVHFTLGTCGGAVA